MLLEQEGAMFALLYLTKANKIQNRNNKQTYLELRTFMANFVSWFFASLAI